MRNNPIFVMSYEKKRYINTRVTIDEARTSRHKNIRSFPRNQPSNKSDNLCRGDESQFPRNCGLGGFP